MVKGSKSHPLSLPLPAAAPNLGFRPLLDCRLTTTSLGSAKHESNQDNMRQDAKASGPLPLFWTDLWGAHPPLAVQKVSTVRNKILKLTVQYDAWWLPQG